MSDALNKLTDRQKDCLRLVVTGRSSKRIAEVLGISPGTVDQHLKAACKLLGQNDRGVAARMLEKWEACLPPQKLDNQPQGVATAPAPAASRFPPASLAEEEDDQPIANVREARIPYEVSPPPVRRSLSVLLFPPIGRPRNDLTPRERLTLMTVQVVIVALSMAALFAAVIAASRYLTWLNKNGG